ncbi:amidohydrolase [Thalassomonas actiniarum]|uniref:Amidohydrolase n=1 Tax=Thalassomonas actiniarum TaxID=485447 RepID=A0AAE9YVW8_9GAMM|nr:amidohydrolase [Thalassomonas actiniarum]WDE02151.1 amidohydrolase [Thalassomonas actiniarum]
MKMKAKKLIGLALSTLLTSNHAFAFADIIVHNAKVTTFDGSNITAFSVKDGKFEQLSHDADTLLKNKQAHTQIIDAKGKRIIPGLNDSHLHVVRGGRFYNLETRWEGITSLKEALSLLSQQAKRTPKGQWVRVIGGWSPYQFEEKRMPTVSELNEAVPDNPAFVLFLYSGGLLNKAGMQALGINKDSKAPKGSRYQRDSSGQPSGMLIADPNPAILYQTISALPQLNPRQQYNSSIQFYRKLLSLGVTSAIDAGGGGHQFPNNYQASTDLALNGELPIRVSKYLFPQQPQQELNQFKSWMTGYQREQNQHSDFDSGYVIEGGGELLVWSASDYENFTSKRPEMAANAEKELEAVVRLHLNNRWPFRLHATYNETINKMLTVLEKINETQPLTKVRWFFDHGETISDDNLIRLKALGGGIAIQGRLAFAGEDFLARYGSEQTRRSPPIKKMLALNIPVGLGTDGTRVSSFNPWSTYYWVVSGKTIGGTQLYDERNILDRLTALKLFTLGSAWFSGEEEVKGAIKVGMYADFSILNQDIFTVDEKKLLQTQAEMTVVNGKVKFATREFGAYATPALKALPAWSPVNFSGNE